MRKIHLLSSLIIITFFACNDSKSKAGQKQSDTEQIVNDVQKTKNHSSIDWENIPNLTDIGDYPFLTAPEGIDIYDFPIGDQPKDGISDIFPFKKFEVYNGTSITTVEGKLAVLYFTEDTSNGFKYDSYIFERNIPTYFNKIGAQLIYKGGFPDDEVLKQKLNENLFTGKYHTYGLADEPESPFYIYAFQNNGKKYIVSIQSNVSQGQVFVIELKDFEPNIAAYVASDIQKQLETNGKAILHINFDTDKATLKPDGLQTVTEIVKVLKSNESMKISINGYTDNSGNESRNLKLSKERAASVKNEIIKAGIDSNRLDSNGFGQDSPIANNTTQDGKAQNRRVELIKM